MGMRASALFGDDNGKFPAVKSILEAVKRFA
jgi:hypothetical protein